MAVAALATAAPVVWFGGPRWAGDEAMRRNRRTTSQAAAFAPGLTAGFGQDFMSCPDGYTGFTRAYDLCFAGRSEKNIRHKLTPAELARSKQIVPAWDAAHPALVIGP